MQLGFERQRGLPQSLNSLPFGPGLLERPLSRVRGVRGLLFGPPRGSDAVVRPRLGGFDLGQVAEARAERVESCAKRRPALLEAVLGRANPLVAQHPREKLVTPRS